MYKHILDCGLLLLREQDSSHYYHINFHAQDKRGHSQRFFGEIRVCVKPKEEDVTCCCPVSPSDAGMLFVTQYAHTLLYDGYIFMPSLINYMAGAVIRSITKLIPYRKYKLADTVTVRSDGEQNDEK